MSANLFTHVKTKLSITDVIGEYVSLKRAGGYFKGNCPFHHERTASFTVTAEKEIFYCFGCHVTGDVISFIAKKENLSQVEAARHLIERYNLDVPEQLMHGIHGTGDQRKRFHELCASVAQWCYEQRNKTTTDYLLKRGFTKETLDAFQIGYFPSGSAALKSLLTRIGEQKFIAADLVEWHIMEQNKQILYSPFQERIIFPINDHLGRTCGFGGRIFRPQDDRPKYYNSKEIEYFNKGSLLFGFDHAKKAMHEHGTAFLVEGYTDCMAMAQAGYQNTVATLGTACTLEHLKQLSRHIHTLYVLYDGDSAGQKAMLRLAELAWEVNLEPMVITLPPDQDPASLLMNASLEPYIAAAKDIFVFYVDSLGGGFSRMPLSEKLRIGHRLLELIGKIESPLKRDLLLQRASEVLGIPFESLSRELAHSHPTPAPVSSPGVPTSVTSGPQVSGLEKRLFLAILADRQLLEKADAVVPHIHPTLQAIIAKLQTDTALSEDEQRMVNQLQVTESAADGAHLLTQLNKQIWKNKVHDLKQQIGQAEREQNYERVQQLLTEFETLKRGLR